MSSDEINNSAAVNAADATEPEVPLEQSNEEEGPEVPDLGVDEELPASDDDDQEVAPAPEDGAMEDDDGLMFNNEVFTKFKSQHVDPHINAMREELAQHKAYLRDAERKLMLYSQKQRSFMTSGYSALNKYMPEN